MTVTLSLPRFAIFLGVGMIGACSAAAIPAFSSRQDPRFHEIYLLAFASEGSEYLVLVRRDDASPSFLTHDPVKRTKRLFAADDRDLEARLLRWPDRATLGAEVAASETGDLLRKAGYHWAEVTQAATFSGAEVVLSGGRIVLRDGEHSATLLQLPDSVPTSVNWLRSADGRRAGLEIGFGGQPRVQTVHVFDLAAAAVDMWFAAGYAAHLEEDFTSAKELWLRCHAAIPDRLEVIYNLACAEARLGDPEAALAYLARVVAEDPERFRDLARLDPDFEALQERLDFRRLIWEPLGTPPD